MENYAKVILYAYPLLETVGKDYAEHIRNKALLSYDSRMGAERLAEYIAGEIIAKEHLEALKQDVDAVLDKLEETEKRLLAIRYFGKGKQLREFLKNERASAGWSERKYFRQQKKLGEKVAMMLRAVGVTQERFRREFSGLEIFKQITRFVEEGRDEKISAAERRSFQ